MQTHVRSNMGSANMAEKVKLRSSDGRVFEADVKTVMSMSGLLKNVIEDTGTDAVISVPEVSGDILQLAIQFLESRSSLLGTPSVPYFDMRSVAATLLKECVSFSNAYDQNFDITRSGREILGDEKRHLHAGKKHRAGTINVDDRETHEDERSWEEKEHDASFVNQVCSKFDWDTIKGLHEVWNRRSPSFEPLFVH
jgi:hypothetical protein